MGFLDDLIGRTRMPKVQEDRIFAITTASVTLQAAGGLDRPRRAGAVFRRLPPGRFSQASDELHKLLDVEGKSGAFTIDDDTDSFGFQWLIVTGDDFETIVAALHGIAQTLMEEGYGDLLLAAAFRFQQKDRPVYWVYEYKRGTFYPFIPTGGHNRDNAEEFRQASIAGEELPVEQDQGCWYPLWDLPV
ncbi:MAG TPA: hypothetical protein VM674_03730 [Candidatus Acidoferrum sp.]|nr:hypothetical protein [Candidatus Acidoferrum sp.]